MLSIRLPNRSKKLLWKNKFWKQNRFKICMFFVAFLLILFLYKTSHFIPHTHNEQLKSEETAENVFRVAYFLQIDSKDEIGKAKRLFDVLHNDDDIFVVHLNAKIDVDSFENFEVFVTERFGSNVYVLPNRIFVSKGGVTSLLALMYGLSFVSQMNFEYFVTLKPSDFPLFRSNELRKLFRHFSKSETNFIKHLKYDSQHTANIDLREKYFEDTGIYKSQTGDGEILIMSPLYKRQKPNLFDYYLGSTDVILHKSLADYIHNSPDNISRTLLSYFSKTPLVLNYFFGTLICNKKAKKFNISNQSLHSGNERNFLKAMNFDEFKIVPSTNISDNSSQLPEHWVESGDILFGEDLSDEEALEVKTILLEKSNHENRIDQFIQNFKHQSSDCQN